MVGEGAMALRVWVGLFVTLSLLVHSATALPAAEKQSDEHIQRILKLIGDKDRDFRAAGLEQVRKSARGPELTRVFAGELSKLDSEGQIALLDALADRGDVAARPAVLELISASHDAAVRAAAIGALGRVGEAEDLPLLIKTATEGGKLERVAARDALTQFSGESVNKSLAAALQSARPNAKEALIEVLATRRASDQFPALLAATVDNAAGVRRAAMNALGQIGRPDEIAQMLPGVLKAQKGGERDEAEKNVARVCERIDNEDQRGTALVEALNTVDAAQRDQLLSLLGRVGGKQLLHFVAEIATGPDAARRQLAIDALSKWPDASVADKLLEIVSHATDPAQRAEAFRGYVKVSAARDRRSDMERFTRLKDAMKEAKTPEEISLVINRLREAYAVETVQFLLPYLDQPQFAQGACQTIVEIAHHREVRDSHKAEFDKALDKVIATSKNPVVVERANRYKRGETWDRRSRSKRL
jgi:HEAT repeat protein